MDGAAALAPTALTVSGAEDEDGDGDAIAAEPAADDDDEAVGVDPAAGVEVKEEPVVPDLVSRHAEWAMSGISLTVHTISLAAVTSASARSLGLLARARRRAASALRLGRLCSLSLRVLPGGSICSPRRRRAFFTRLARCYDFVARRTRSGLTVT